MFDRTTRSRLPIFAIVLVLAAGTAVRAAEKPDYSGTWLLNRAESDDPRAQITEMMENRRRSSGVAAGAGAAGRQGGGSGGVAGRQGGGGGGGGGAGGGGAGGGIASAAAARADRASGFTGGGGNPRSLMGLGQIVSQGVDRLRIDHLDPEMHVEDSSGQRLVIFTDGREVVREEEGVGKTKLKTRWKKDRVIVSITFPTTEGQTPAIRVVYELDGADRLIVTSEVSVSGPGRPAKPLSIARVYDRSEA